MGEIYKLKEEKKHR